MIGKDEFPNIWYYTRTSINRLGRQILHRENKKGETRRTLSKKKVQIRTRFFTSQFHSLHNIQGISKTPNTSPADEPVTAIVNTSPAEEHVTAIVNTSPAEEHVTAIVNTSPAEEPVTAVVTSLTSAQSPLVLKSPFA